MRQKKDLFDTIHLSDRLPYMKDLNITTKITKKDNAVLDIEGELQVEDFMSFRDEAIKYLGKDVEVDGFRKGTAPEDVLIKQIGEGRILTEMAHIALSHVYTQVLRDEKIQAIGQPQVQITKLAEDNPLGFTFTTATFPEIELADYKKLAKKIEKNKAEEVSEEEIQKMLENVQKMRRSEENKGEEIKEGEEEKELEPLTDDFVKGLGDFKDVADFTAKMKENIKADKERRVGDTWRMEIIDAIIKDSKMNLPEILIEGELQTLMNQMKGDIEKAGMQYEDYLEKSGKTEEDIQKELRGDAEKRSKIQLILNKIATEENLKPDAEVLEKEVAHVLEQHKDAEKSRVEAYVEMMLTNEKVFEFLSQIQ
ncbi:MAG: FKBP-type peptidyl-prolyl cis-trans isomerase (trigger factor) [Flavobacteriaceae bacterium]|jgi:FKBP-type peptidyl-prolyl cis-trans isomerase (trigger factor)